MSIAELIAKKKLEIKDKQNTKAEIYADTSLIPPQPIRLDQNDKRCPKQCGNFDGGNRSCRNHCDRSWYDNYDRRVELRNQATRKHLSPIDSDIIRLEKEIVVLEEKSKIPLLRQQLFTSTSEYEKLSPNDPEFRQKQIDQKKSLYERAVALDALERKHNMFGNLPTSKREPIIVTPEPITITHPAEIIHKPLTIGTIDFDYTKLAIGGAAIVGILALIIWRIK